VIDPKINIRSKSALSTQVHNNAGTALAESAVQTRAYELYEIRTCLRAPKTASEALITISRSVRNTATLLQVLVATKIARLSGLDLADA
jgi:hypothetical protein